MNKTFKPPTRDEIAVQVVKMGVLTVNGEIQNNIKEEIQQFYLKNNPSNAKFAEYLRLKYGWRGVAVFDDRTAYRPCEFHYNNAGLQYRYRDVDKNIKLECLEWKAVATMVAEQIKDGKYLDKQSVLQNLSTAIQAHSIKPFKTKGIIENAER